MGFFFSYTQMDINSRANLNIHPTIKIISILLPEYFFILILSLIYFD